MRVSYNWLKQYVDTDLDAVELSSRLTFAGLELDEIETRGDEIRGVVVAKVLTCEAVAGSDHLHKLSVDVGTAEPLTIICGAPNIAAGQIVACALVGAVLPGGFAIGKRKTFGVESCGMICSQKELGLSEDHSGIWVLDTYFAGEEAPLGVDIVQALHLRDDVMVIELTPNRSDCLGMINLAREAAAVTGGSLHLPEISYPEAGGPVQDAIAITVEDEKLCPRYAARLVRGVQIGPSPLWMQNYLLAAGMRPINNVVDISNFVMLEMNQPLHTFDYQQIKGHKIQVRAARKGETMQTLDGKDRTFQGDEILICDGAGPVCVAGVMGGMETEVTAATRDILIEAACFDPVHIRRASRRLGIPSEASMRFEKGIDVSNCDTACQRAVQLLVQYCGGVADRGVVDVRAAAYQDGFPTKQVILRPERVNQILGTGYSQEQVCQVMQALRFPYQELREMLLVAVPPYRQDITLEVDLIEEVARILGYDRIPATLPLNASTGGRDLEQNLMLKLKDTCVALGLNEAVNYSFISPKEVDRLGLAPDHPWRTNLTIANPLSEEQSVMRQSLLPGLLHAAARNQSRRNLDLRFFETGMIFVPAEQDIQSRQPVEIPTLGMLLCGRPEENWLHQSKEYDFYDLKGMVELLAIQLGVGPFQFSRCQATYLHPGRSAQISLDGLTVGYLGELHPEAAEAYELTGRVQVAEISLPSLLLAAGRQENRPHDLPKYPASTRDIAVIGSVDVDAAVVAQCIWENGGPALRQVRLFDLYDQAPIPAGQRSLAYGLQFRKDDGTLTDQEVDQAFADIVAALEHRCGYRLR